jgi:hypothetical protein
MLNKIRYFIPLAVAITGLSVLAFGMAQQVNRLMAYDPQVQIAEDVANALNNGINPQVIAGRGQIDISKSLAPFVILYDSKGKPTNSSASLSGKVPVPPSGVFNFTSKNGQDRLTWQPQDNVRIATVIIKYNNGYVLAGRSMAEVEGRAQKLLYQVIFGWAAILAATAAAVFIFIPEPKEPKRRNR